MNPEDKILKTIKQFFNEIFEVGQNFRGYKYTIYKRSWLEKIDLKETDADEAKSARTTKELQKQLIKKFKKRIKVEAQVAEGMTLRFETLDVNDNIEINSSKLQAFDILDLESGSAFEISLADAYAEFFKDVLKALLDSRVKKLYMCMRNHNYKGAGKSGFIKVASSEMIHQYILLAKLYKLDVILIDLYPLCNNHE